VSGAHDVGDTRTGRPAPMLEHVARFADALREAGLSVSPSAVIDLCRCFAHIDISRRGDFRAAARATLVDRRENLSLFDTTFDRFWGAFESDDARSRSAPLSAEVRGAAKGIAQAVSKVAEADGAADADSGSDGYSADEVLMLKDLGLLSPQEQDRMRRALEHVVSELASLRARRWSRTNARRVLDLRATLRKEALFGRDLIRLRFRRRDIDKARLVLLCDVSGSMDRYARFLVEFVFALTDVLPRAEIGLFATRMTLITRSLDRYDTRGSLESVAQQVRDWGGGTNIGLCLREFNDRLGPTLLRGRTVVMILSDGWDRGDPALLAQELGRLRSKVHRLVWLNPLLGSEGYQPLCGGIRAALPFIDQFLPAHNAASIAAAARALCAAWD
jgi:uncharacterized protein with von Willebrand factor type A (vWA) domain